MNRWRGAFPVLRYTTYLAIAWSMRIPVSDLLRADNVLEPALWFWDSTTGDPYGRLCFGGVGWLMGSEPVPILPVGEQQKSPNADQSPECMAFAGHTLSLFHNPFRVLSVLSNPKLTKRTSCTGRVGMRISEVPRNQTAQIGGAHVKITAAKNPRRPIKVTLSGGTALAISECRKFQPDIRFPFHSDRLSASRIAE